jgi:hypothetical protein
LLCFILIAGISFFFVAKISNPKGNENTFILKKIFPQANNFSKKEGTPPHFKAYKRFLRIG